MFFASGKFKKNFFFFHFVLLRKIGVLALLLDAKLRFCVAMYATCVGEGLSTRFFHFAQTSSFLSKRKKIADCGGCKRLHAGSKEKCSCINNMG